MLEHSSDQIIKKPPKQLIVDWVEEANEKLDSNFCIVKKSFLVTGLSNALGKEENRLIRDDTVRKEIYEIIVEVFGEVNMGFCEPEQTDVDPFNSDSEEEEDVNEEDISEYGESSENTYALPGMSEYMNIDSDDSSSISTPSYEPLSDIDDDDVMY